MVKVESCWALTMGNVLSAAARQEGCGHRGSTAATEKPDVKPSISEQSGYRRYVYRIYTNQPLDSLPAKCSGKARGKHEEISPCLTEKQDMFIFLGSRKSVFSLETFLGGRNEWVYC